MFATNMTPRARWRAALRLQPVDRLPFWPKIFAAYARAHSSHAASRSLASLHEFIGSDRHEFVPVCWTETRSRTRTVVETQGEQRIVRFETPLGSTQRVERYDPPSASWHPVEMPVKTVADIHRLIAWYEDCCPEFSPEQKSKAIAAVKEYDECAATASCIGESPLMEWLEYLAGIENGHLLLVDHQQEVEALFAAMHRVLKRRAEIEFAHTPADMVYLVENTSTTLISPLQYRRYCSPVIAEYAAIARAHNKHFVLHMCGFLKGILPDLAKLPVTAFEAFTSPPVGDTRLQDGRSICPHICLIGGTNATLWLQPATTIISEIARDLDALPHHRGLIITSAGVMPPAATPEKIREVCQFVRSYPGRM